MDTHTRLDRLHFHAADMYLNVLVQLGIDITETTACSSLPAPHGIKRPMISTRLRA